MKNVNDIRADILAAMHGMTSAEYALEKARDNLTSVTSEYLDRHPELLKTKTTTTPATVSKSTNVYKMLGADTGKFQPHDIDLDALERAKAACRKLVADNPDRYGNIIKQQGV